MEQNSNRTQEDLCLICGENKAARTNSHFTSMCMIKSNTGKRGYEETFTIKAHEAKSDVYFGASNLKNKDPEIKPDPHSADFIFCDSCENKLSALEAYVCEILNLKLRNKNQAMNFPTEQTNDGIIFRKCLKLHPRIFSLFIFSIIWRQCLEQRLANGTVIISENFFEHIRKVLNTSLSADLSETESQTVIDTLSPFYVFTKEKFEQASENWINPNGMVSNPYIFYLNEYVVLVYHDGKEKLFFPIDTQFVNSPMSMVKIGFLSDDLWAMFQGLSREHQAKIYWDTLIKKMQSMVSMDYDAAKNLLLEKAIQIGLSTGKNFERCLEEAIESLKDEYGKQKGI